MLRVATSLAMLAFVLMANWGASSEALALTQADCRLCHTGSTTGSMSATHHALIQTKGLTCSTCHATVSDGSGGFTTQVINDCVVCHSSAGHDAVHNPITTSTACAPCHSLGVLNEHLSRTSTCQTCHSSTNPVVTGAIAAGKAGQPVECLTCHGQATAGHLAEHNPITTPANCATCHTLGVVNEHLSRHSTCQTCHASTNPVVTGTIAAGKAGQPVSCASCHTIDHMAAHNPITTPANCATCHTLGVVNEHLSRTSTCQTCHASTNPVVTGTIAAGKAGQPVSCASCHTIDHSAAHNPITTPAACASCHTLGVINEHLSRHSTCQTCHSSTNATVTGVIAAGKAGQPVDCTSCHGQLNHQAAHDGNVLMPYNDCSSCHNVNLITLHAERNFACATCHNSADATIQNVVKSGLAGTKVYCANCHVTFGNHAVQHNKITLPTDVSSFIAAHEQATPPTYCFGCHTSTDPTVVKSINDGMFGTQVQCASCHAGQIFGNMPPVAEAGPSQTVTTGKVVNFSGSGSTDPNGNTTIVSYAWNFGDGTTGTGVSTSHTYTKAGAYTVTLTVTDDKGATGTDTTVVTVQDPIAYVSADQATRISNLSSQTTSESYGSKTDITAKMKDANLTDTSVTVTNGSSDAVISMKLNKDPLNSTQVILRLYVPSLSSQQSLRIYPYKTDGNTIDSTSYVSYTVTTPGWKEIDVTSVAAKMNSFGWMKFRIANMTSTLYVSESNFTLK